MSETTDAGYARTVGRIGKALHGEDAAGRLKALAALARAGFPRAVAEAVLRMGEDEAEARIAAFRA